MKAKIVNGQCVAVMSHREAALIAAVFGHAMPASFSDEVNEVCESLGNIYGYPDNFMKSFGFKDNSPESFEGHMANLDIDEEHYV